MPPSRMGAGGVGGHELPDTLYPLHAWPAPACWLAGLTCGLLDVLLVQVFPAALAALLDPPCR